MGVYSYSAIAGVSNSWVAPPGVTLVRVECWGAGGAGGGRTTEGAAGGGGGAAYAMRYISVTPGVSYPFYAAPRSGQSTGNGPDGEASYWGDGSLVFAAGDEGKMNWMLIHLKW